MNERDLLIAMSNITKGIKAYLVVMPFVMLDIAMSKSLSSSSSTA